jgi:hypothetical protein
LIILVVTTQHASHPPPGGQIPLTRNEIAHLLTTLVIEPVRDACHRRRRHQHRARTCRYQWQAREP